MSSFQNLENGAPESNYTEKKLSWLRSQVIGGGETEFDTPFGKRRLTYADHTASGRCLYYIEDYIIKNVLPFYGNELIFPLFYHKKCPPFCDNDLVFYTLSKFFTKVVPH